MKGMDNNLEAQPSESTPGGFNEFDPKYRCFRNRCHIIKGSLYLIYITIAVTVVQDSVVVIALLAGFYGDSKKYGGFVGGMILLQIIMFRAVLIGLRRQKRKGLSQFLGLRVLDFFYTGTLAIIALTTIGKEGSTAFFQFLFGLVVTVFNGYTLYIIWHCHAYLGDKQREEEIAAAAASRDAAMQMQPTGQQSAAGGIGMPHSQVVPPSYDYHQQQQPPEHQPSY